MEPSMVLESATTRTVMKHAKALGCLVEKTHGSVYTQRGRPDLYIWVPRPGDYAVTLCVEMKQVGEKLKPLQEKCLRDRAKIGIITLAKPSVQEVVECIKNIQAGSHP